MTVLLKKYEMLIRKEYGVGKLNDFLPLRRKSL